MPLSKGENVPCQRGGVVNFVWCSFIRKGEIRRLEEVNKQTSTPHNHQPVDVSLQQPLPSRSYR